MTAGFGIDRVHHAGLQKKLAHIVSRSYAAMLHLKPRSCQNYCWLSDDKPVTAFLGSANYTNNAFGRSQIEAMDKTDANLASDFFAEQFENTINCLNEDIEDVVLVNTPRAKVEIQRARWFS